MKKLLQYLSNKYNYTKNIVHLLDISKKIGFDKAIYLINLFENEYGHHASVSSGKPIDKLLNPIPWYTYPAIEYLSQLDFQDKNVFEYGSGNSSIFWASLAKSVTSVEIDPVWFETISQSKTRNLNISLKETHLEYVNFIKSEGRMYDVIIIDGAYRYDCAKVAIQHIADDGLIILDNSERYPSMCADLRRNNLLQVDFSGLGPINYYTWMTSLFFKQKCQFKVLNQSNYFPIGSLCQTLDN